MGAGYTKLITYLDVGPEAKEDKLKKQYARILTSGTTPKKTDLIWKTVPLSTTDVFKNVESFKEGAQFIHSGRINKQNVLVFILQDNADSVAFATAYIMILSGLPVDEAERVIDNAVKEANVKLDKKYHKSLEALRDSTSPRLLREELFRRAGDYSASLLSEDVQKIYELAGLAKPSAEQISLEIPIVISRDMTVKDKAAEKVKELRSHVDNVIHTENHKPTARVEELPASDAHKPMTLELVDHSQPVAPHGPSDNFSTKNTALGNTELAEMHSAYVDKSLTGKDLQFRDNDHAVVAKFTGTTANNIADAKGMVTELNSVHVTDPKAKTNHTVTHMSGSKPLENAAVTRTNIFPSRYEPTHLAPVTRSQNGNIVQNDGQRKIKITRRVNQDNQAHLKKVDEYMATRIDGSANEYHKTIRIVRPNRKV